MSYPALVWEQPLGLLFHLALTHSVVPTATLEPCVSQNLSKVIRVWPQTLFSLPLHHLFRHESLHLATGGVGLSCGTVQVTDSGLTTLL